MILHNMLEHFYDALKCFLGEKKKLLFLPKQFLRLSFMLMRHFTALNLVTILSECSQSKICPVISNEYWILVSRSHLIVSLVLYSLQVFTQVCCCFSVIFAFNPKKWDGINSVAFELFRVKCFLCSKVRFIFPSSHPSCFQMAFARTTEGSQTYIQQEPSFSREAHSHLVISRVHARKYHYTSLASDKRNNTCMTYHAST